MRTAIILLLVAGLGAVYWWQNNGEKAKPAAPAAAVQRSASSSVTGATPAQEPSEHNWMKRSLDRARDVRDQARTGTAEGQNP
jgi:hypothetical protein